MDVNTIVIKLIWWHCSFSNIRHTTFRNIIVILPFAYISEGKKLNIFAEEETFHLQIVIIRGVTTLSYSIVCIVCINNFLKLNSHWFHTELYWLFILWHTLQKIWAIMKSTFNIINKIWKLILKVNYFLFLMILLINS